MIFSFITFQKVIKLFCVSFFFLALNSFSQDPTCFQITTENGLPSNEIYSMVQDRQGFIWLGCDAGIYKYDGVKYTQYKSKDQRSRAFSGLTLSAEGRVYAYNFSGQLFYTEGDSLYCLNSWSGKLSNIICDSNSNLWVCGDNGLHQYNEKTKKWKCYNDFDGDGKADKEAFTRSCEVKENAVYFICSKGIGIIKNDNLNVVPFIYPANTVCGEYELAVGKKYTWLFHRSKALFFRLFNNKIERFDSPYLSEVLGNSKFTDLREFADGKLYIPTYTGLIIYEPAKDSGTIIYPKKAISYVLIDRENNYWLSTLQSGLMRIPNMGLKVWKLDHNDESSKKVNKVISVKNHLYATNISGQVAFLDPQLNEMKVFSAAVKADIQCLFYDEKRDAICFNISNTLYQLKDEKISVLNASFPAAKFISPLYNQYTVASSFGLFLYEDLGYSGTKEWLLNSWTREVYFDEPNSRLFAATNDGLVLLSRENDRWIIKDTLLKGKQINSLCYDFKNKQLYVLSFEDKLFCIDGANFIQAVFELPSSIHASQIRLKDNKLLLATNGGLLCYDLATKQNTLFTRLDGLASNEVMYMDFIGENIYLATSLGINQFPFSTKQHNVLSKLYLDDVLVDNNKVDSGKIVLKYNQSLSLKLSGLSFSSNGAFNYAYRFVSSDSTWIKLPSSIERLEFQSIPYGDFVLEIKLIDDLGKDSENTIVLKGQVKPPFWLSTWFMSIEALVLIIVLLLGFRYRLRKVKKKQLEELKRIKLENELRLVQQSALKAQMNPHFIFNVLNSIKGYIYENDKKNAVLYLSEFSDLMRKVLDSSSIEKIKLSEELSILKIYIELEAMLLDSEFTYEINLEKAIDTEAVYIPGLLIQPYVENAFKHGLRHKKGNKHLRLNIRLSEPENMLLISIEDNGVGLKAAEQINALQNKAHQSFGSKATARRIELLNYDKANAVNVEMDEIIGDKADISGTIVKLRILLQ